MTLINKIYPHVPKPVRRVLKGPFFKLTAGWIAFKDELEIITGRRDKLTPPMRLAQLIGTSGYAEFIESGNFHLERVMKGMLDLQPHHHVLDLGCGVGKKTRAMLRYLTEGRYEGIDIMPECIRWCQENYTTRFPNFHFQVADIYNKSYNPTGKMSAADYRLPFDNSSFDCVILFSVFTHMLPAEVDNYLKEISRVLKPGGKCVISYFLLNQYTLGAIARGVNQNQFPYHHDDEGYRLWSDEYPEAVVAYHESFIRNRYRNHDLEIQEPIFNGQWAWLAAHVQDYVVAVRK